MALMARFASSHPFGIDPSGPIVFQPDYRHPWQKPVADTTLRFESTACYSKLVYTSLRLFVDTRVEAFSI